MIRKIHEPGCPKRKSPWLDKVCTCAEIEDELVAGYLSDQPGPHQSLANLIRAARREGLLRPIQQYGGGHAPASTP